MVGFTKKSNHRPLLAVGFSVVEYRGMMWRLVVSNSRTRLTLPYTLSCQDLWSVLLESSWASNYSHRNNWLFLCKPDRHYHHSKSMKIRQTRILDRHFFNIVDEAVIGCSFLEWGIWLVLFSGWLWDTGFCHLISSISSDVNGWCYTTFQSSFGFERGLAVGCHPGDCRFVRRQQPRIL
jgi:hypothetical protein